MTIAAGVLAVALVSGGNGADPRTPAGLPGMAPPFLGTAVVGGGGLSAAIDSYGDVVDLRTAPAGRALIENPAARQAAGTVPAATGIVPRVRIDGRDLPLWRADSVRQSYRPGTEVAIVAARFGPAWVRIAYAAGGGRLGCLTRSTGPRVSFAIADPAAGARLRCDDAAARSIVHGAAAGDRRWLSSARPLGPGAPAWAGALYERSLLTLRALTGRRSGAVAAGARDGWAYVWPRDAGAAALAFAAAGYRGEARRVAHFLLGLDLDAAARFHADGAPVAGRGAQGDALGWAVAAAGAAGLPAPTRPSADAPAPWRDRPDYQEGTPGPYLANALAATAPEVDGPQVRLYGGKSARQPGGQGIWNEFEAQGRLVRRAGDAGSGLDSAAAWAVRPFPHPGLFAAARRTMLALAAQRTRFGIAPGEGWPGTDPWSAPTAWTAWSLAALSARERRTGAVQAARRDRRVALALLGALRRAATPAGALPERVDAATGIPASTTPLAWSHAFAVLALRRLWP